MWCHLCQEVIVTWDWRWPATFYAQRKIMGHREEHVKQLDTKAGPRPLHPGKPESRNHHGGQPKGGTR